MVSSIVTRSRRLRRLYLRSASASPIVKNRLRRDQLGRRCSTQREGQTAPLAGRLTASTAIHKASRPRHTMIPLVSLAVEATICVHDPYDPAVELLTTAVPRELAVLVPISVPLHHPRPKGNPPGLSRTLIWKHGSKAYVAA